MPRCVASCNHAHLLAPIQPGLTPHGLRHSHRTWMTEDGIPEILAEQRLGHQVPGMRGRYAHASTRMRDDPKATLQARWEDSLRCRATISPHSPEQLLDELLAPFRARDHQPSEQVTPQAAQRQTLARTAQRTGTKTRAQRRA